ncbi:MAG TPA: GNAT family N-acetyltransferase [Marmoricola sp.]|nr:GNAT family N-acetyltransferase [Marmoricola sp.]
MPPAKRTARKRPVSKPTAPHLVEPQLKHITDATFTEFHQAIARGFQEPYHSELLEFDKQIFDRRRMFGFKVGRRWVSTCGDFARRLVVPGGAEVPTAGVTVVTVHPPFRRRGLLTRMMRYQLEQVAKRGEPLAALWASESLIYGRYGYGPASTRAVLTGTNRRLGFLPGVVTEGSVDEVTREEFLRVAPGLHAAMRAERPGTMARDDVVWEFAVFDKEFARNGASEMRYVLHYDEAGDADGFATYRFKEDWQEEPAGEVRIKELWAEDPCSYASLWRYLLDLDLARTFRLWSAPLDEPLRHLVADARAVKTELTDNLYVRVVDVAAALTARRYAAGVDLVIEVDDPILPDNTGRWRIVTDGDPAGSTAEVTRVTSAPDVSMGVLELGSIYLGGVALADLHRAGRVDEHTPGAVAAASTAFGWHRMPCCPDMF